MVNNSASTRDSLSLQEILDALNDGDCQAILRETAEPMTANELIETCDIPKSTIYRKLERLSQASLVQEQDVINPNGGRTTKYERNFDDVVVSMDEDDDFSVTVKRPQRNFDERLADIWSEIGNEI